MPMSTTEQARLLSMVDIFGPLSQEELVELAMHTPDTFLEQGDILYTLRGGKRGFSSSRRGRYRSTK